jgi:N-acetylmuramoyl-L-alanine amidase
MTRNFSVFIKTSVLFLAVAFASTIHFVEKNFDAEQIECLAYNMYYEARGEPKLGQIAVGNVTMNRVANKHYPDTVCEVVTQKSRKTCQFSWVCMNKIPQVKHKEFSKFRELATNIYKGNVGDVTHGATHFHATYVEPEWAQAKRMTTKIGNHLFYRK